LPVIENFSADAGESFIRRGKVDRSIEQMLKLIGVIQEIRLFPDEISLA